VTTRLPARDRPDHPAGQMKSCDECAVEFRRKVDTSASDWEQRRFCSVRCSNTQRQRLGVLVSAASGPRLPEPPPLREWTRDAACQDSWFDFVPDTRAEALPALFECQTSRCPVATECLAFALATRAHGVWGGQFLRFGEVA
jgi:hypothetical protein